jgi:hypothetical protein
MKLANGFMYVIEDDEQPPENGMISYVSNVVVIDYDESNDYLQSLGIKKWKRIQVLPNGLITTGLTYNKREGFSKKVYHVVLAKSSDIVGVCD